MRHVSLRFATVAVALAGCSLVVEPVVRVDATRGDVLSGDAAEDALAHDTAEEAYPEDAHVLDAGEQDVTLEEAGVVCGATTCAPGEACCASTRTCYNPSCPSCCMPMTSLDAMSADAVPGYDAYRPDTRDEFVTDAGTDASSTSRDTGYDASGVMCGATTCAPGEACCAGTRTCYGPHCLSCCM
jgi:hypothetical protein